MLKHIVSKDEVPAQKGDWVIADKLFKFKNTVFSPKSAMRGPKFWDPQTALLLMLKHIVSKDEVPAPKGGWDIAD